jgi:CheY-like chemotaxis protein
MSSPARILIIDDDPAFLAAYRSLLGSEGYRVETASDRLAALGRLDEENWDVVLIDQKLHGPGGPDTGLELVHEIQVRSPEAKTIVVTGFASPDAITRAFESGIYDYLDKEGRQFPALLRAKVRNAAEVARERRLGALEGGSAESALRQLWEEVLTASDANRKGALLEELVALLFKTIRGFHVATIRRRNEVEEIDVLVRNESHDPFWRGESRYFLVECKNWTRPVDGPELADFARKLENRFGRCTLGFFVALGGFTRGFREERRAMRKEQHLIVPLDGRDFELLLDSSDRNSELKRLHERAAVAENGNGHRPV